MVMPKFYRLNKLEVKKNLNPAEGLLYRLDKENMQWKVFQCGNKKQTSDLLT